MTPEVVSIGRGNTLVIPENIMKELGLKEGNEVMIYVEDGKIIIEPMPKDPYKVLKEVIGEPYKESRDEDKAVNWLKRNSGN